MVSKNSSEAAVHRSTWRAGVFTTLLVVTAFVIELFTPRGVSEWALYLGPVAWATFYMSRAVSRGVTLLCSVLVVIGYFVSPPGLTPAYAIVNRVLALSALWLTEIFILRNRSYQEALTEKEQRFREIAENIREVFWLTDWSTRRNVYVSPAYETVWGRPREDILNNPSTWNASIHPDDRARVEASYRQGLAKGVWREEYRIVRPDGSVRWIRDRGFPISDADGRNVRVAGIAEDVTEQKRMQDAITALVKGTAAVGEEFLLSLVRETANAFRARYTFLGELIAERPERIRTLAVWSDGKHAENFEYALDGTPCANVTERGTCVYRHGVQKEFPRDVLLQQMGVESYVGTPLRDTNGTCIGIFVVLHDGPLDPEWDPVPVIEIFASRASAELGRLRAENALRVSEERLQLALEASSDGLWDWNVRTGEVYFSQRWLKALGYGPDELPAHVSAWERLIHPDDMPRVRKALDEHLAGRTPVYEREYRLLRKDGAWRWNLDRGKVVERDADGRPLRMIGVDADISARKQLEETHRALELKIQQAQRLESLGTLAGGIAHDFNNLLTSMLGYADLALIELPPLAPARHHIEEVMKGARHAAELTQQMLAYSGKGQFIVQPVLLSDVVEEMRHLLQLSISKKCVLNIRTESNLPPVEVDISQLRQIIMNLVINASDAIGNRSGIISVHVGAIECDRAYLANTWVDEELPTGLYVFVEISDTGAGMTADVRQRIFDPFFTTKATGRGLGLAAVLGIVRGHKAAIKVYSEPGRGTTFKVLFRASEHEAIGLVKPASDTANWRGSGTVLVADDEESVRALAKTMLQNMGFNVITAADGREAVRLVTDNSHDLRLVLLDMTMPHLSGPDAYRAMHRHSPNLPIILSSGYSEQAATSQFAGKGLAGFLQKPYRYEELVIAVRKALSA